jgi:hypothetical protein
MLYKFSYIIKSDTELCHFCCIRQRSLVDGVHNAEFLKMEALSGTFQLMEHQWIAIFEKADIGRMCSSLYMLTNETGPLKLFKRLSYLSLNMTFSIFFPTPSTFGTRNGNGTDGIFYPVWCAWLLNGWSILCAKLEDPQFKTLDVIHKRHTHPHTQSRR